MTLPVLETPIYELILPSTNKKVKYRPFLVKEYKILLTNVETDAAEISRIVLELVDNCTFKTLNINKLAHFDVEYLFLNIRAKSISETTNLIVNCDCGNKIDHAMDLTKVKVKKDKNINNKILISEDVGVIMRYPRFDEIVEIHDDNNNEHIISLVCNCIDSVYTKDKVYERDSFTNEELENFVNTFTKKQFDKLEEFFKYIPKIVHEINEVCPACNRINQVVLEGLQNFFV
jgi:hypothetical protein